MTHTPGPLVNDNDTLKTIPSDTDFTPSLWHSKDVNGMIRLVFWNGYAMEVQQIGQGSVFNILAINYDGEDITATYFENKTYPGSCTAEKVAQVMFRLMQYSEKK